MEQQKSLKELIKNSGFSINHIANEVLNIKPSYLSSCVNGNKNLSAFREKVLRDYLRKVASV